MIKQYLAEMEKVRSLGKTKEATLNAIAASDFGQTVSSISRSWAKACKFLRIEDLHFHDLRHDGVSRLFEMDWDIPGLRASLDIEIGIP